MDMVERVARAIEPYVAVMTGNSESSGDPNFENLANWKEEAAYVALAAIAATRLDPALQSESCPSDIVDAGRNEIMAWDLDPNDFKKANAAVVDCFNAMIDAALGEGE